MMTEAAASQTDPELRAAARALMRSPGAAEWLRAQAAIPRVDARRGWDAPMTAALLALACLLAAFDLGVSVDAAPRPAKPDAATPPVPAVQAVPIDPDAREAIALAQDWRLAGDELGVRDRIAGVIDHPARARGWTAERIDEDSFLVVFREPAGAPAYAFEVDLESQRVLTAPETVERLTAMRLRDEAEAQRRLVAHAR